MSIRSLSIKDAFLLEARTPPFFCIGAALTRCSHRDPSASRLSAKRIVRRGSADDTPAAILRAGYLSISGTDGLYRDHDEPRHELIPEPHMTGLSRDRTTMIWGRNEPATMAVNLDVTRVPTAPARYNRFEVIFGWPVWFRSLLLCLVP